MLLLLTTAAEGGGGFNPLEMAGGGNTLWTLVIFAIAVPIIWKVVMGPVTRALEERDDHAARAIAAAEKASGDAEKARADVEVALGEARAEAAELLAKARERAEGRQHEIVEAAKSEAAGMVDSARKAIRAEQDKAISTIRNEVVDIALNAAGKVLEREVSSEDDRRLVTEVVASRDTSPN
jgi:F-type H+-transporting ATPase subunit b